MKKILLVCLLFSSRTALAATYYVATTGGNDGNNCALAQNVATPKKTMAAGIGCLSAGDTLLVRAGTYGESVFLAIPSGFAGSPTTLKGYPGDPAPTMNGSLTLALENYIVWNGITIDDAGDSGDTTDCILINSGHDITITNSELVNCQRHGVLTGDGNGANLSNINLTYLNVHNTGQGYMTSSDPRHHNFYISAHNFTTGPILLDHNNSHNEGNPADSVSGGPSGCSCNSWGIQVFSSTGGFLNNVTVSNNYVHDNNQGIILGSGSNFFAYNNLVINNDKTTSGGEAAITVGYGEGAGMDNIQVLNNTIVGNNFAGSYAVSVGTFSGPTLTNTIVRNNIFWQNGNDSINLVFGTGTVSTPNLSVDPSFVNAAGQDYHITSGSAARNAGVNLSATFTTDKDGNTRPAAGSWDDGALMFIGPIPPPPPTILTFTAAAQ